MPWLWFAIRDAGGITGPAAVVLPAAGFAALIVAGIAFGFRQRVAGATAMSLFLVCLVATVEPRLPLRTDTPSPAITVVSDNVLATSRHPDKSAATMASRDADVMVAVEMSDAFIGYMEQRAQRYPYTSRSGAQGVWSRWPVASLPLPQGLPADRIARFTIDADGQPIVVYAVHLFNPLHETTISEQEEMVHRLADAIAAETDPVILAGDLNMTDRAAGYRLLADQMHDAMRTGWWAASTYRHGIWRDLSLRIDHLFVPADWCAVDAKTFGVPGSDHRGVESTVGPCPA